MAEDDTTESDSNEPSLIAKIKSDKKLMIHGWWRRFTSSFAYWWCGVLFSLKR